MPLLYTRNYFGGNVVELAGRVVDPDYQHNKFGIDMLEDFLKQYTPDQLITYTRNGSILRMLAHYSKLIYPLQLDSVLKEIGKDLADTSTEIDGVLYQPHRYGEEGLFKGFDPANRSFDKTDVPLMERFTHLGSVSAALVVVADVEKRN